MTAKGVRVAFLAYTELTNGIPSPHPWSVNRASAAQILSDAHRARTDGAQVVIVSLHWGGSPARRTSPRSSASTCIVVLPAGVVWRTDPADAAALRASYERTVAVAGRGPRIQPIPAHLP